MKAFSCFFNSLITIITWCFKAIINFFSWIILIILYIILSMCKRIEETNNK